MRFSQRLGISPVEKAIQRESMDEELRNSLWSLVQGVYWDSYESNRSRMYGRSDFVEGSNLNPLVTSLWLHYFKQPIDTVHRYFGDCVSHLREYFFSAEWYEVYDFIEFVSKEGPEGSKSIFVDLCNNFMDRENSAYRFVNGVLTEITSEEEIQSVEEAIASASAFPGVREHLSTALSLMSDRNYPDYRNSIKESISAVESLCRHLVNDKKATLGSALAILEKKKNLHPALKASFSSLYGYTSDADGIRHALMAQDSLTKTDSRYMLVSCTAFINYAIALTSD
ncbi:hypothetical protein OCT51_06195 [Halomonas sp. LR3S48]|uniref:AbiJ-NTD4 domain-containing protein n=1 Tax=Halomonas sp. LR3S48 TaxID=2982694 RepID=UPI0021E389DC|nr:hypothetical protein [Halomonas sp. LR3S48]UYG04950.1 hypothetical protein OCT51_06195 [Halomonas sp. LR3S48]